MRGPRLGLVVLALVATGAGTARANGNNTHAWISLHALDHLPEGHLRDLLTRPEMRLALLNGTIFPDGGYVLDDDYGETAHWEPFVDAYKDWIRDTYAMPYTEGSAAEHVAFLMGVASHGMADQTFDSMFMEAARVYDAEGWSDTLLDSLDTATDVLLVADTGQDLALDVFVPADDLVAVFERVGYPVDAPTLEAGQDLLHRLVLSYGTDTGLNDPERVAAYRAQYPWSAANLLDEHVAGSPPCEGAVVAAYWIALWDRLHGEMEQENVVIATAPSDGGAGHVTDYTRVESQVVIVFGHGVDHDTLDITVTDAGGAPVEIEVDPWASRYTNVVRLLPQQDWAEDSDYTVTVGAGLSSIDGLALASDWSFSFSTRPQTGEPDPPCSDPTPSTGEPDIGDAGSSRGGCRAGTGTGTAAIATIVLLVIAARRRAR